MPNYIGMVIGKKSRGKKGGRVRSRIQQRTEKLGIAESLIIRCLKGEVEALKELGDKGREGRRIIYAMPTLEANAKEFLTGLAQYNKSMVNIYTAGGKAGLDIDKAEDQLNLANTRYGNDQSLRSEKRKFDNRLEQERYQNQKEFQRLAAYIDYFKLQVDAGYKRDVMEANLELLQLDENERQELAQIDHYLQYGSTGGEQYLPKKDYTAKKLPTSSTPVVGAIGGWVKGIWSKTLKP